jgi:hypothetical protein
MGFGTNETSLVTKGDRPRVTQARVVLFKCSVMKDQCFLPILLGTNNFAKYNKDVTAMPSCYKKFPNTFSCLWFLSAHRLESAWATLGGAQGQSTRPFTQQ